MLIKMTGITKHYQMGETIVKALDGISMEVDAGELVAIVGQSGSGKSTLMNLIGCLDQPSSGEYYLENQPVLSLHERSISAIRSRKIGFVFQGFNLIPSLTAFENVELPLIYRRFPKSIRKKMTEEALRIVGLGDRADHRPSQLSGGQQQRTAIARAIAGKPPLILADEPTGNLDSVSGSDVMNILTRLNRSGHTVILITHSPEIAAAAGRIIRIRDGHIVENG